MKIVNWGHGLSEVEINGHNWLITRKYTLGFNERQCNIYHGGCWSAKAKFEVPESTILNPSYVE